MTKDQKNQLLKLARESIGHYLKTQKQFVKDTSDFSSELQEKRGTFVTLTIGGQLRGCIGHIIAIQPLYLDVIDNAVNAAFEDPRFEPLAEDELEDIKIEISVLSQPKPLEYKGADDLLKKLRPDVDGVIIKQGFYQATFLPQVWEQLKQPEDFLSHLCAKAGLDSNAWRKGDLKVETYQVENFEE